MIKLRCMVKHCEKWQERERERVSDIDNVGNKEDDRQEQGGHHSLPPMFPTLDTSQSPKG